MNCALFLMLTVHCPELRRQWRESEGKKENTPEISMNISKRPRLRVLKPQIFILGIVKLSLFS